MIKTLSVIVVCAVIGGVLYWFLSPFIASTISQILPQASTWLTQLPDTISTITTSLQENWHLVAGAIGGTTMIGGYVANWLHKRGLEKQKIADTFKLSEAQTRYFQLDAEKRGLENTVEQLEGKIDLLEENAENVTELSTQLTKAKEEIQTLIAERNQLVRLFPNVKDAEKMIEEKMKVH